MASLCLSCSAQLQHNSPYVAVNIQGTDRFDETSDDSNEVCVSLQCDGNKGIACPHKVVWMKTEAFANSVARRGVILGVSFFCQEAVKFPTSVEVSQLIMFVLYTVNLWSTYSTLLPMKRLLLSTITDDSLPEVAIVDGGKGPSKRLHNLQRRIQRAELRHK